MSDQPERKEATTDGGGLPTRQSFDVGELPRWVSGLLPLVLLLGTLGLFLTSSPFAGVQQGEPLPDVTISHATLPGDETVVLHVTNNGPGTVTISQVLVDEAYWDFRLVGSDGDRTLAPLESARIEIPYHWNPGWDLEVALVTAGGATFHHTIVAPSRTPGFSVGLLRTLAAIGLFVGVIPVALGMLWFPFLRGMSDRWVHAVLLFAVGILAFLAIDAAVEAIELVEQIPGSFEGAALIALGVLGSFLLVQAASSWGSDEAPDGDGLRRGLQIAYLVALGIGLHNLAEGLAIGSSFALGRVSLGAFLVVGFMLHNVTEGPAVVAPLAREGRPALWHFAVLGLLAGAPVIAGGWIGSLAYSPTLGAFFLAIGVGAILQVDWEIVQLVRAGNGRPGSITNLVAFLVGFTIMYVTNLFVTL